MKPILSNTWKTFTAIASTISGQHHDRALALDWELTLEFITATRPDTGRELQKQHSSQTVHKFKRRLVRDIQRHGTLDVLHHGIKGSSCYFQLAYFKPATSLNSQHQAFYGKNTLSVIRQCRDSQVKTCDALDLVIFLNGLPTFTLELKNKITGQTVENAKKRYQDDRLPKNEPLLQFGRCLVHFAVGDDKIWLIPKLESKRTAFLPFNRGCRGGAGNLLNPDGYAGAYPREDILSPDSVLELVGSFIYIENGDQPAKLIFLRYHQRDAVGKLVAHARQHGPGQQYLIQHSAGSGNTIAWTAHRLVSLHNDQNRHVLDSVIVITDRCVLDRQLQNTARQFKQVPGVERYPCITDLELCKSFTETSVVISTLSFSQQDTARDEATRFLWFFWTFPMRRGQGSAFGPSHVGAATGESHQPGVAVGCGVPVGSGESPGRDCHPVCCAVHAPRPAHMP